MLEILAPMLQSAFLGPKANIPDAISSFTEFWQATYVEMDEPEDGWPKEIKTCLKAIEGPRDDESELESSEVEEQLIYLDEHPRDVSPEIELLQPAFDVQPSNPYRFTVQEDSVSANTSGLSPSFATPTKRQGTPFVEFPSLLSPSLSSSLSPRRLPVTPKKTPRSEARLRSLSDKENHSPLPAIPSVMDRIMSSPQASLFATPGKKRSRPDSEDSQRAIKRQKRVYGSSSALESIPETEFGIASNIVPFPPVTTPTKEESRLNLKGLTPVPAFSFFGNSPVNRPTTTPTKKPKTAKRKGEFLDAVEVCTYKAVRRRTASMPETKIGPPRCKQFNLQRTRSLTGLATEAKEVSSRKRRRTSFNSQDSSDSLSPSPAKHARYQSEDMIGSGESI